MTHEWSGRELIEVRDWGKPLIRFHGLLNGQYFIPARRIDRVARRCVPDLFLSENCREQLTCSGLARTLASLHADQPRPDGTALGRSLQASLHPPALLLRLAVVEWPLDSLTDWLIPWQDVSCHRISPTGCLSIYVWLYSPFVGTWPLFHFLNPIHSR
jgi:hypothetical protein